MKVFAFCLCVLILPLLIPTAVKAQGRQQLSQMNFSTIDVDNLSDAQIRQFMSEVRKTGLSDSQIDQVALAKGLPPQELQKLKARIAMIRSSDSSRVAEMRAVPTDTSGPLSQPFTFGAATDSVVMAQQDLANAIDALRPKIFGEELFANPHMSFAPDLSIPTPSDYQVGPQDELVISIYGYSEANYQLTVSKEGSINIPYVGVVYVSGLTMEQATERIRSKLSAVYSGIRSGKTSLQVSLGTIRSIQVTIMGEVTAPGTYTLPSLASVFNALYAAGGPNRSGSYRDIEVIRNSKIIQHLDVYDFLMRGDQSGNIRLQDQDVIRIPTYGERVQILGEVKRPGIFEMKQGEHLTDLISYAGGFSDSAYTAMIHAVRINGKEKTVADISADQYASFQPKNGDKYDVSPIIDKFANRVVIDGAVYRPGPFELTEGLTLSQLVRKADGLREDAFLPRGYIVRQNPDLTSSTIQFNVAKVMNGEQADIPLQKEDEVHVYSIFDLRDLYTVSIQGSVRMPGQFKYADSMTLEDLIMQAGGFSQGASPRRIEVSRRWIDTAHAGATSAHIAQVFQEDVNEDLQLQASKFVLHPYDMVVVRDLPGFEVQKQVSIQGEVMYPGLYTLSQKNERISDLVQRAGGLTDLAYPEGASLRRLSQLDSSGLNRMRKMQFEKLQGALVQDSSHLREWNDLVVQNNYVGIHLDQILERPDAPDDLFLQAGDTLYVPRKLQTVRVNGEVLYPVITPYQQNRHMRYYISQAGGFSSDAKKGRLYVVYANGFVKSTHNFLFFRNYPNVDPGAEIFVPLKPQNRLSTRDILGITAGVSSLALTIVAILNILK
jgi:protein involved in polysaccharide export with SLBB domain